MEKIKTEIRAPDSAKVSVVVPLNLVQAVSLLSWNNSKSKARSRLKIILEAQSFYLQLKKNVQYTSIQSYRRGITIGSLCSRKLKGFDAREGK